MRATCFSCIGICIASLSLSTVTTTRPAKCWAALYGCHFPFMLGHPRPTAIHQTAQAIAQHNGKRHSLNAALQFAGLVTATSDRRRIYSGIPKTCSKIRPRFSASSLSSLGSKIAQIWIKSFLVSLDKVSRASDHYFG